MYGVGRADNLKETFFSSCPHCIYKGSSRACKRSKSAENTAHEMARQQYRLKFCDLVTSRHIIRPHICIVYAQQLVWRLRVNLVKPLSGCKQCWKLE